MFDAKSLDVQMFPEFCRILCFHYAHTENPALKSGKTLQASPAGYGFSGHYLDWNGKADFQDFQAISVTGFNGLAIKISVK